jgi:diketogulonate reductase-like aldo/keto reductase
MISRLDHTRRDFLRASVGGLAAALGAPLAGLEASELRSASPAAQQSLPARPIPSTGEELPIVGLGSTAPVLEIPSHGVEPVVSVIETLLEEGGRVVDTSVRPAEIDAPFGQVLQRPAIREEIFLCTKINAPDAETGAGQMRQTQRLFGRRTMDLVQIESLRGLEPLWPRLREWKESGEARYIGVTVSESSNHDSLEAFMRREAPDFVHVNYSLLEPDAEERILPLARDRGFAVLVNRPFMNGSYFRRTAGRTLPDWAADFDCETWAQFSIKYILADPAVTVVLTETTNPEHMAENVAAGRGRLPDDAARRRMREVAATI